MGRKVRKHFAVHEVFHRPFRERIAETPSPKVEFHARVVVVHLERLSVRHADGRHGNIAVCEYRIRFGHGRQIDLLVELAMPVDVAVLQMPCAERKQGLVGAYELRFPVAEAA